MATKKIVNKIDLFSRIAMFLIYSWFGILKVIGISPADSVVHQLFDVTFLPLIFDFNTFYILFAWFEVVLGIAFLFPQLTKYVFWVFMAHITMTMLPLVLLPNLIWQNGLGLTFSGQYIVKNIALIALMLKIKQDYKH
jgi:uncharacterized membrane protein YphA (DoxX/SURF4 family)